MADQPLQSKETQENNEGDIDVQEEAQDDKNVEIRVQKALEQRDEERKKTEELQKKLEDLETKLESFSNQQANTSNEDNEVFTDEEEKVLQRAAKFLEKNGFVKKDDLKQVEAITKRGQMMTELQNKYNNTDYPDFKPDEVMVYAQKNGFGENLESAYFSMHRDAILRVDAKKLNTQTVDSEKPTGAETGNPEITRADIENMDVNEWQKNKAKIMSAFRKAATGR